MDFSQFDLTDPFVRRALAETLAEDNGLDYQDEYIRKALNDEIAAAAQAKPIDGERNFFGDTVSRLARGGVHLADTAIHAVDTAVGGSETLQGWSDSLDKAKQNVGLLRPDKSEHEEGWVKRSYGQALESAPMSAVPWAGTMAGASMGAVAGPAGAVAGGLIGGALAMGGLLGLGTYGQRKEEVERKLTATRPDLTPDEISKMSHDNAKDHTFGEIFGEGAGDLASWAILSKVPGGKAIFKGGKAILAELVKPNAFKAIALGVGKAMPFEVGSEVGTAIWQNEADKAIGVEQGTSTDAALAAIGPAMFLSAGMGVAVGGYSANQRRVQYNALNSEDQETRAQAVDQVAGTLAEATDQQTAKKWRDMALGFVQNGQPIPLDMNLAELSANEPEVAAPEAQDQPAETILKAESVDEAIQEAEAEIAKPGWLAPTAPDLEESAWLQQGVAAKAYNQGRNELGATPASRAGLLGQAMEPLQVAAPADPLTELLSTISTADQPTLLQVADGLHGLVEGSPELAPYQRQLSDAITARQRILWEESNVGRGKVSSDQGGVAAVQPEQPTVGRDTEPVGEDSGQLGEGEGSAGVEQESPLLTAARQHVAETGDTTMGGLMKALDVDIDTAEKLLEQVRATTPLPRNVGGTQAATVGADTGGFLNDQAIRKAGATSPATTAGDAQGFIADHGVRKATGTATAAPTADTDGFVRDQQIRRDAMGRGPKPTRAADEPARAFLARKREWEKGSTSSQHNGEHPTQAPNVNHLEKPWMLTKEEYHRAIQSRFGMGAEARQSVGSAFSAGRGGELAEGVPYRQVNYEQHARKVARAIRSGEAVPAGVLAEYPGYLEKYRRPPETRKREGENSVSQTGENETQAELPRTDETQAGAGGAGMVAADNMDLASLGAAERAEVLRKRFPDARAIDIIKLNRSIRESATGSVGSAVKGERAGIPKSWAEKNKKDDEYEKKKAIEGVTAPSSGEASPPAANGNGEGGPQKYTVANRWDSSKDGYKVELVKRGQWTTKKDGGISRLGEKIALSKWDDLSPAAQRILTPLIQADYGSRVVDAPPAAHPSASKATPEKPAGVATSGQRQEQGAKEPWQMTSGEFSAQELEADEYRDQLEGSAQDLRDFRQNTDLAWRRSVESRAEVGRVPDAALDDYIEKYGEDTFSSMFRGVAEKGRAGYVLPKNRGQEGFTPVSKKYVSDLKPHERTWDQQRTAIKQGMPRKISLAEWKEERANHKSAVQKALWNGEKVPASVLADYPELADAKPRKDADMADVAETDFGNMEQPAQPAQAEAASGERGEGFARENVKKGHYIKRKQPGLGDRKVPWELVSVVSAGGVMVDNKTFVVPFDQITDIRTGMPDLGRGEVIFKDGAPVVRKVSAQTTSEKDAETASSDAEKSDVSPKSPNAPIADFGEKIGGARKDVWAKSLDDMRQVDDADVSAQTLSKVWPAPDYQKMLEEEGADKSTVALVRALRDSIPTKPRAGWKLQKWVEAVTAARGVAVGLLDGSIDTARARHAIQVVNASKLGEGILDQAELYELVGHEKSLAGIRIASAQYSLLNGVEYNPSKELWSVEQQAKATSFSNWPRQLSIGETRQEAIEKFVAKYNEMEINKPASKQVDFSIYSYRSGKEGFYVGKKVGRNYIDLAGPFDTAKEARKYKSENQEALIGKLAKAKEIPSERRDTNNPRVGEDMRGGQDVTPEMFREAFGFRGVEFGNWVEQKKRQSDLNEAYDALMDMAAILEISPKAISLNGELALAFGARGSGGKSAGGNTPAAHYEPGKVVINLTKKRGAGSLGHEWWHALDNYFARMRKAEGDMTEALDVSLVERGSAYEHKGEVRKEMVEAFGGVMRAIRSTAMKARASKLDNRRSAEYWTTKPEMSARAFESYLISKLHDQGASNDYLANIVDDQTWKAAESLGFELDDSYPYPTAGEMPKIRGAFDHFFQTVEQKETDKGVALFSSTALPPSSRADIPGELTQAFGKLRARVLMRKISVLESQEEAKALVARLGGKLSAAWHGSPHEFDEFRMSAVGTGEGAQAYGYGLYFASAKAVAEHYRDKLASGRERDALVRSWADFAAKFPDEASWFADEIGSLSIGGKITDEEFGTALQNIHYHAEHGEAQRVSDEIADFVLKNAPKINISGRLYKVELAPQEDEYLLWDRPLSEQSEKVKAALEKARNSAKFAKNAVVERKTGNEWYSRLSSEFGDKRAASEYLHSLGIRGIKYMGESSYNYVIFDEKDVEITAKFSKDGAIQGFAVDGRVYLVKDGIEKGHTIPVLKHEFAHIARLGLRGTKPWQALLRSVDERMNEDSATGKALREARKKVPADTDADLIAEETMAYAVELSPEVGLVRRAIAMIKRFLVNMGVSSNIFTVEDWSALAAATLRGQTRVAMGEGVRWSVRDLFKPVDTGSAAFLRWFGDSKVVDADGKPLRVYRGEHGKIEAKSGRTAPSVPTTGVKPLREEIGYGDFQSRIGSLTFSDRSDAASLYAEQPNDRGLDEIAGRPRVIPAYLKIENPIINSPGEPFIDGRDLAKALGANAAIRLFTKHAYWVENTQNWEEINEGYKYDGVGSYLAQNPKGINDLYMDAYPLLDDPEAVSALKAAGYDGAIHGGNGDTADSTEYRVFDESQAKSALSNTGDFSPSDPRIRYSKRFEADEADERNPLSWDAPLDSKKDTFLYNAQNKFIDLFRVQDAIQKHGGTIDEETDVRLSEELYHKRSAKRVDDFLINEVKPLMAELAEVAQDEKEFERFLWARHAAEANESLRLRNPNAEELREMKRVALERRNALAAKDEVKAFLAKEREMAAAKHDVETGEADDSLLVVLGQELDEMTASQTVQEYVKTRARHEGLKKVKPFDGDNTWLSGMKDDEAKAFMRGLSQEKKTAYSTLAAKWDNLIKQTRQTLVEYELEDQETVDSWAAAFDFYVPLNREDMDGGKGIGQGFSVKGASTKGRTGSYRAVSNILANIVMQRERAIVRGEKSAISRALHGLATANPNKDFWSIEIPPTERTVDPVTGMVINKADMGFKSRPNVVVNRFINDKGKIEERAVVFNDHNKRALRMAESLKNLDTQDLGSILGASAKITRFFSAMNTQYNVVFGPVNLVRDAQAAALNLSTTPLKDKKAAVVRRIAGIIPSLYKAVRAENAGRPLQTEIAKAWREMQLEGGTTGFRDMFADSNERAERLRADILQIKQGKGKRAIFALRQWVSDYNDMLENSTRLAVYMEARESGISKKRAAQLAKDVTLNFNRKGQVATQAGAMYAFFNAAAQGTEKMYRTMTGPAGKKILTGGLLLGAAQTMLLAAAGFDEDEPPEFIRERNLILPIGGKKYITVPMPLGFHVIPNLTRVPTEWALRGFKEPGKAVTEIAAIFAEAFNPLGNAGFSMQTFAPTPMDPFIALGENKDWTGRPIARQDFNTLKPTPGHTRARDTASWPSEMVSRALNLLTGGNEYVPGMLSPTPDQIDYLVGQAAGGVGREAGKLLNVGRAAARGESSPAYRIPFVGRFYGNSGDMSGVASRYYTNLKRVNRIALELDGIRENGGNVAKFIRSNPEARTIRYTEATYRNIQKLQRAKRRMLEGNASRSRVEAIDRRIIETMRRFNERTNPNI